MLRNLRVTPFPNPLSSCNLYFLSLFSYTSFYTFCLFPLSLLPGSLINHFPYLCIPPVPIFLYLLPSCTYFPSIHISKTHFFFHPFFLIPIHLGTYFSHPNQFHQVTFNLSTHFPVIVSDAQSHTTYSM